MEGQLGLPCGVDVNHLFGLDVAFLVVNAGFDHAVPDGLQPRGNSHGKGPTSKAGVRVRRVPVGQQPGMAA